MSLLNELTSQLSGPALEALSQNLGADTGTTQSAITAALPMLIGAMAKNTASDEGAQALSGALSRDHDGSIMDNLTGFLGSSDNGPGAAILGHVLGGKQNNVEQGVSQLSGMNPAMVGMLLKNLAPVVMGYLGKQQSSRGLNPGDLAGMLNTERETAQSSGSPAMDMLGKFLDQDGDGSMLDDIGGMLGGFLGKR